MEMEDSEFFHSRHFRTAIFLIFLVIGLLLCFFMLKPFLKVLGWSIALTIIAYPLYALLKKKIKNPSLSAALTCVCIVIAVLLPAFFLILGISEESRELSARLQAYFAAGGAAKLLQNPLFNKLYGLLNRYLDFKELENNLLDFLKQASSSIGKYGLIIAGNLVTHIFLTFLVLVTSFFLLRDGKKLIYQVRFIIPLSPQETARLFQRVADTIKANVYSWLLIGITQGTLLGLAFWLLGLPAPLLWGGLTVLLCFIPYVGAPVVWVPAALILLAKGIYWKAILLAIWGAAVIGMVDNIFRPLIVGGSLKLHLMLVFFAIFGGLFFMGPLGLIMGPVILVTTLNLLEVLKSQMASKEPEKEEIIPAAEKRD